jgi:hypothetical protein
MLLHCENASEVWRELGLQNTIRKALEVDLAGSTVLEELLCLKNSEEYTGTEKHLTETILVSC